MGQQFLVKVNQYLLNMSDTEVDDTGRPRRATTQKLIEFTEDELVEEQPQLFRQPKNPPLKKKTTKKDQNLEIELEREKIALEREKLKIEMERLALEREKIQLQKQENEPSAKAVPFKIKLQPFDPKCDDILTFLSEFEAIGEQAEWNEKQKVLQLRTLLTGETRQISSQSSSTFGDLRKALVDRYGKRPHEYFNELVNVKREGNETYRGLFSRIDKYLRRSIEDKDPIEILREEFFLKALPPAQAQWVRRNKGSSTVVEAAEDYIPPKGPREVGPSQGFTGNGKGSGPSQGFTGNGKGSGPGNGQNHGNHRKDVICFKCNGKGHFANKCPKISLVSKIIKHECDGLIYIPGHVNDREVSFVKDTGASMTLIKEDLVDSSCILEGQKTTLYTAIGQPFEAKIGIVKLDTPYFKGHAQVGLVPSLVADALLGNDVISRKNVNVVTRAQVRQETNEEVLFDRKMNESDVKPKEIEAIKDSETTETVNIENLHGINAEKLAELQRNDPKLKSCRDKAVSTETACTIPLAFYWENGILKRKWTSANQQKQGYQIVLPKTLRQSIIKLAHNQPLAGHLGTEKTKERILKSFYWPGMFHEISDYCSSCDVCQKVAKRTNVKVPMINTPIISTPFFKISMDIVGPLAKTKKGNRFILTIVDDATRYPEAFALKSCDAESVANALIELFSRVGIPKVILTDQGTNFTSKLIKELFTLLKVKGVTTSPYHPQANGKTERFNGTLKSILKKLCTTEELEWDTLLPYALFAYREVPHQETGFAPFDLLYGWPIRGPTEVIKEFMAGEEEIQMSTIEHIIKIRQRLQDVTSVVKENLTKRKEFVKKWYDKTASRREFQPGDEVLILLPSESSRMEAQWKGPYRVTERINDVNYKVNVGGRRGVAVYHINLLREYKRSILFVAEKTEDTDGLEEATPCTENNETISDLNFGENLDHCQKQEVRKIFIKYENVFTNKPGHCTLTEHSIRTTTETPIFQRPYRIPEAKQAAVKDAIEEMLKQRQIQPSNSPWSSPVVLVNKPDGTIRICIDYRKLNEITVSDAYPVPRISDILEKVGNAKFLSHFDLTKGYWQVPLSEDSREKSAFVTPYGLYEFLVMPFGMKTSPATFIRLMDKVLHDEKNVVTYFDDIVIFSDSWESHLEDIENVVKKLQEANLTVRPSKCKIGATQLKCLGHIVGNGSVTPDPSKVQAIQDFPLPVTKKNLKSFLGLTGYYRAYIAKYAEISVLLTNMLKKSEPTKLKWNSEQVTAFKLLKEALMTAPVLITPKFENPFIVQTDASQYAIGAVLSQEMIDGDHPVSYISRKLLPREQNYSTIEKELLAIVWAIGSFSYYLDGRKFFVETDHNPLSWLHRMKDRNQRLLRWALSLQPFDFEVRYRRGTKNQNADSLSRI